MTSLQLRNKFFKDDDCVFESVIEKTFSDAFYNETGATYSKARMPNGVTDGIIKKDGYWILQETKRNITVHDEEFKYALLQAMMYLGNVYYDISLYDISKFKGLVLNSAHYFVFVEKSELDNLMEDFEDLWWKYFRVAPSKAYKEFDLWWYIKSHNIKMKYANLDINTTIDLNYIWKSA